MYLNYFSIFMVEFHLYTIANLLFLYFKGMPLMDVDYLF